MISYSICLWFISLFPTAFDLKKNHSRKLQEYGKKENVLRDHCQNIRAPLPRESDGQSPVSSGPLRAHEDRRWDCAWQRWEEWREEEWWRRDKGDEPDFRPRPRGLVSFGVFVTNIASVFSSVKWAQVCITMEHMFITPPPADWLLRNHKHGVFENRFMSPFYPWRDEAP